MKLDVSADYLLMTQVYIIVENSAFAGASLNFGYVSNWTFKWLVGFHPAKTETMVIQEKQYINLPPLLMNNTQLKSTDKKILMHINTVQWRFLCVRKQAL